MTGYFYLIQSDNSETYRIGKSKHNPRVDILFLLKVSDVDIFEKKVIGIFKSEYEEIGMGCFQGNLNSMANKGKPSHPRACAKQVIEKAKFLTDLGFKQAIFPPHERPHFPSPFGCGFLRLERYRVHRL